MNRCAGRTEISGPAQQVLRFVEDAFLVDGEGTEAVAINFIEDAIYLDPDTGRMGAYGPPRDFLSPGAHPKAHAFFSQARIT